LKVRPDQGGIRTDCAQHRAIGHHQPAHHFRLLAEPVGLLDLPSGIFPGLIRTCLGHEFPQGGVFFEGPDQRPQTGLQFRPLIDSHGLQGEAMPHLAPKANGWQTVLQLPHGCTTLRTLEDRQLPGKTGRWSTHALLGQ